MSATLKWIVVTMLGAGTAGYVVYDGLAQTPIKAGVSAAGMPIEPVKIGDQTFQLEVAATNNTVQRGLSKRATIPAGTGMLFVFSQSRILSFWMIDCLLDIDVAYLDRAGTVVGLYTMKVEPPRAQGEEDAAYKLRLKHYPSDEDALYAIELPTGSFAKLGIRVGSRIPLNFAKLQGMVQ